VRTLTYTRGGPEPVRSFNQTHRGIVLINKHRSFAVNALTLSAKLALAVCSMITLSTVANATENVPVNGDVHMSAALYTVSESAGSVALTVERSGGDTGVVSVTYFTQNDAAVAGKDYTAVSGTLTWASGDGANKTINIPIINTKTPITGTRSFFLRLQAVGGTLLGTHTGATVDITSSTASTPAATKLLSEWVGCNDAVDETPQLKAALAAAANNAFTLIVNCPVRVHTGFNGGTPIAIPDGVTLSFEGSGEFVTAGTAFTIAHLTEVTLINWNLVE
jgi:hypothetical protein